VPLRNRLLLNLLFETEEGRVEPELQHRINFFAVILLELLERIHIPGINDERLLANRMRLDSQRETNVGVVQIIRRADAHVMDS
jgi:hypothetical protein